MSDTPETDKRLVDISSREVEIKTRYVRADFARKLERERDEARADLEVLKDYIDHIKERASFSKSHS